MDVYEKCPAFQNDRYFIRKLEKRDAADLFYVYSDEKAVPFFNKDNCNGDDFHYKTMQRMEEAVEFWLNSYVWKYFVRFSIEDRKTDTVIGTIELFHRDEENGFPECGLLRLDLKSEYETVSEIVSILSLILTPAKELFNCKNFATKAVPEAKERLLALKKLGFGMKPITMYGKEGVTHTDYYLKKEEKKILLVYCHPSEDSCTAELKESFISGLNDAGHSLEISDLYKQRFNPVLSEQEYKREAFYNENASVPGDVLAEQEKINRADVIVFLFPNFWTSAPAMLEGWFQRVWTFGYAYGKQRMKVLKKAIFLMVMGGNAKEEIRNSQIEAIKCTMLSDRMLGRAEECEFHVFDETTRGYGNDANRDKNLQAYREKCYEIARNI